MIKKCKRLLRSEQGFTLVELLCTLIVVTLATGMITLMTSLGLNTFEKSVSTSEAQVLCETLSNVVAGDLRSFDGSKINGRGTVITEETTSGGKTYLKLYKAYTSGAKVGQLYIEVTDGTMESSGSNVNTIDIAPSPAYTYGVRPAITIEEHKTGTKIEYFTVTIEIMDSDGNSVLSKNTMEIKALGSAGL